MHRMASFVCAKRQQTAFMPAVHPRCSLDGVGCRLTLSGFGCPCRCRVRIVGRRWALVTARTSSAWRLQS